MRLAIIGILGLFCCKNEAVAQAASAKKCLEIESAFERNGVQESKITRKFDEKGKLILETEVVKSPYRGDFTSETSYEYDANGNNIKISERVNGVEKKTIVKAFDANGKLLKENNKASNKVFTETTTNGNQSEQVYYEADGSISVKETKLFDNKGNLLKKEMIGKSGKVSMSEEKTYTAKGNVLKHTLNDVVANAITTTDFTYDKNDNVLTDKTLRNNEPYAETKYEYNAANQLVKKIRFNSRGKEDYFLTYDYDNSGNLVKESYFYNNKLVSYQTSEYDANQNRIKENYYDSKGNITMKKTWAFSCQ